MIELTRLNGHKIAVNADLIRFAESQPDTTLTLVTGEKLIVLESCAEVIAIAFNHRVAILRTAWPDAAQAFVPRAAINTTHLHE